MCGMQISILGSLAISGVTSLIDHVVSPVVYDRSAEVRDRTRALLRALDVDLDGAEKPLV